MVPAEVNTLRQKWNLQFTDPVLEASFKDWFNRLQTIADLEVLRYLVGLLLLLAVGLCAHGLLSVAAMAALMLFDTEWYIAHRSAVVAAVRITSTAVLVTHRYLHPAFYSDSLLMALVGNCSLTLMVNSFRNRLRFSNHLLVLLAKLYLCSVANAFVYSDPSRAACAYLSLPATSLIQLASALLPSAAVYLFEAALRRKYAAGAITPQARLAAGVTLAH